ncbi:MAG: protein kinase [Thermodesulfobacteriota bacterium]
MTGEQIGPYKILKLLGKGGMGIVYLGMHTKLEQPVAIKVMTSEYSSQEAMRERFIQEAKLQARLSHPNVVNILNYLEDESNIYLVMEYVEGSTLEQVLQLEGALTLSKSLHVMESVLSALEFMHGKGIIHRDIKPANIMFTESGQVKVTDFGIAKTIGSRGMTKTGTQLGTVWYMSPERIRGEPIDHAADIYALGVTLYQMATGRVPFNSDSEYEVMRAHIEESPPPPVDINSEIPGILNDIILKALAKKPEDRFSSAGEFRNALRQVGEISYSNSKTVVADDRKTPMEKIRSAAGDLKRRFRFTGFEEEGPYLGKLTRKQVYLLISASILLAGLAILYILFGYPESETRQKLPLVDQSIRPPQGPVIAGHQNGFVAPNESPKNTEPLPPGVLPAPEKKGSPINPPAAPSPKDESNRSPAPEKEPSGSKTPGDQNKPVPTSPEQAGPSKTEKTDLSQPAPKKPVVKKQSQGMESAAIREPPAIRKPPEEGTSNSAYSVYSRMLRSPDPASKRRAAKIIYERYLNDPIMIELANEELLKEYPKQGDNRHHVDAMSWLCNILGASRNEKYKSTLKKVAEDAPHRKLRGYAEKNLKKLSDS